MEINEPFFFITTPAPPKIGGELRVVVGDHKGHPYKNRTPIKMILSTFFALLLTILAFGSSTAWAVTVSATGLTFGTLVAGGSGNATAVITVNAASETPYTVTLDAGLNLTGGARNVKSGATIGASYHLYKDAAQTAEWGDAGFANTYTAGGAATGVAGTGSGAKQTLTVYGTVIANTAPGVFSDGVTVAVNY